MSNKLATAALSGASRRPLLWLRERRFSVLFLFLLVSLPAAPFADRHGLGYYAFRVVGVGVTLLTVWAASLRRGVLAAVLILALPALLEHLMLDPGDAGALALTRRSLNLLFDLVVIATIFRHVFAPRQDRRERVMGALCIYLLIGFAFASVYGMLLVFNPHAFYLDPVLNAQALPTRFDMMYFSFGTMTELGAAGVAAVDPLTRAVSLLEAITGILYLAVLIARLLADYRRD